MKQDSVLVACPTYDGLSDVLDQYVSAFKAFKWEDKELLLVDNTRDGGAYCEIHASWRCQIHPEAPTGGIGAGYHPGSLSDPRD